MKLSVHDIDDYSPEERELCHNALVLLDGVEQRHCTVADEEQGYIMRHKRDERGNLCADHLDRVIEERVYGRVQILDKRQQPGYQTTLPLADKAQQLGA